jgi:hypothetical protein
MGSTSGTYGEQELCVNGFVMEVWGKQATLKT